MVRRRGAGAITAEVDAGPAELVPDPDRDGGWTLLVGGTPQSHVDLADPTRLEFEYIRWLAHLAGVLPELGSVLHLGGGAWTLARYLTAVRPGTRQRVIELDGRLVEFVRANLPPPPRSGIRVRVDDARAALASARPAGADLVVLDAFTGARIPAHLTSVEFVRLAAAALRPAGCFAANLADGAPLRFSRSVTATVAAVFPHTCLVAMPGTLRGRRFGNLLALGSHLPLDVPALSRVLAAEPFPARMVSGSDVTAFVAGATPITDELAAPSPVPPAGWLSDLTR